MVESFCKLKNIGVFYDAKEKNSSCTSFLHTLDELFIKLNMLLKSYRIIGQNCFLKNQRNAFIKSSQNCSKALNTLEKKRSSLGLHKKEALDNLTFDIKKLFLEHIFILAKFAALCEVLPSLKPTLALMQKDLNHLVSLGIFKN